MRLLVPQAAGRRPFREEREEPPNARVAESLLLGVHDSADGDFCQTGKPLLQVARHGRRPVSPPGEVTRRRLAATFPPALTSSGVRHAPSGEFPAS